MVTHMLGTATLEMEAWKTGMKNSRSEGTVGFAVAAKVTLYTMRSPRLLDSVGDNVMPGAKVSWEPERVCLPSTEVTSSQC